MWGGKNRSVDRGSKRKILFCNGIFYPSVAGHQGNRQAKQRDFWKMNVSSALQTLAFFRSLSSKTLHRLQLQMAHRYKIKLNKIEGGGKQGKGSRKFRVPWGGGEWGHDQSSFPTYPRST